MATANTLPTEHRYIVLRGQLLDVAGLSPVEVNDLQAAADAGEVRCPTCGGSMRAAIGEHGPVAVHVGENPYAEHEPEDPPMRDAKRTIQEHLAQMFPSGTVALDTHIPELGLLPDAVLVNPKGGKMAVEYQARDMRADDVTQRCAAYEDQGIRCLWLLDGRRLNLGKTGGTVRKALLEGLETALLGAGEPLIYLQGKNVTWLRPQPQARELALLGEKRLGRVECLTFTHSLRELRVRSGRWWAPGYLQPRAPRAPGALNKTLQRKLDQLRSGG